jgi:hypothetical protein
VITDLHRELILANSKDSEDAYYHEPKSRVGQKEDMVMFWNTRTKILHELIFKRIGRDVRQVDQKAETEVRFSDDGYFWLGAWRVYILV